MAERIELEISTQGMRAGAEEAKTLLASIPKAAGQAAKDADAEMKRAAASAKAFTSAMERQASAEAAARQKQATALNNARVAAVAQNSTLQKQIAIQKQVLTGTLSLAQGQEQLARTSIDVKVKNDALSASLAKSKTEYAANAAAIRAMQKPVQENVSWLSKLASAATLVKGALVGGVVLAAANQLKTMTVNAIDAADAIDDLASQLNISAEALQELQYAFEQGGSSAEAFTKGFQNLQKNVGDAAAGIGKARVVFKEMGIDAKQFAADLAADPTKALVQFADKVKAIQNPAQQTAVVMRLLGDPSWVNIMKGGGEAVEANIEKVRKLGLVSNETAKAGGDLKNEMTDLAQVMNTQLTTALVNLGPALLDVARWTLDLTAKFGGLIDKIFQFSSAAKNARLAELQGEMAKTKKELEAAEAATQNVGESATAAAMGVVYLSDKYSEQTKAAAQLRGELVTMNVQHGSSTTAVEKHTGALLDMSTATKHVATEAEKAAEAARKARAQLMADTEVLSKQADIYQDVIDGKIGLSDATAKAAAIEKGAKVNVDGLTVAYEKQAKRLADNKDAIAETNKAIDELVKRNSELLKTVNNTTESLEEETRVQQAGLTALKEAVAGGKTFAEAQKASARAIELTTLWLQKYNEMMAKGMDEAGARKFANEMVALKGKTLDLAEAADKFGKDYEKALKTAILTTGELRGLFSDVIDDMLSGGKNLLDKFKDFGKQMGVKLIEGIAFGKQGLENQVLIPNFSQLFGQNGTVSGIFSSGGQSAGSSFVSGFMHWIAGDPSFANVTSGSSSTASIWSNVTSGSSTAGIASGKQFGGGFMSGLDSIFGTSGSATGGFAGAMAGTGLGMAAGAPIGDWASRQLGVGQTKQGKMGGMVGGAVGGIGGGIGGAVLLGATIGTIVPGLGNLIGAAIGAAVGIIMGMIGGGALGDLFAPGRIEQEKMGLTKYFEKVFDGLNFKIMSEKAVAKGLIDYDEVRDAGETLGLIFADSMGKGATQGTMIRFPGQLFANFRKMGLSVEEAKEKVLELAKAMGVDFVSSIEQIGMAMDKNASGPTLLGLDITKEELKEARKNLKEYGDTSHMTIAELDALALANGNVGSTIITLNQLYAGAVDLQTGWADHAAAVAGVNGLLADKFKDVATTGGMAEESITDLSEKVRNGTLSVEEALIAYNKWADSVGKARLELQDVALDADAFAPLAGSIEDTTLTLDELLTTLQELDQQLVALAERQISIRTSLAGNLKDIGAITPLEDVTGRRDAARAALDRSRAVVDPPGQRRRTAPTTEERLQLANDLAAYRQVLVEDFNLRKAAIEQGRQENLAAITQREQAATQEIQARDAGQRQALQEQMAAAQAAGQAAIQAAQEQGQALVEAARAQGQAAIEAARKQGQAEGEAARKQGQEQVQAAREQGQAEVDAARAAGDAIIKAEEDRAEAAMALLEKEKEAQTEASQLRQEALTAEIELLQQWRDLATALGEQIHALITAAESPLSGPEQFGAIQRETERARQRLEGTSGAARIPAMQDLARLLGEQLSASPYQRLDPRQRELFSKLTQELTKLQQEAGREGAPLEDKQAHLLLLQAQSVDALKSIDARIEAAQAAADVARERAEAQANALVEAAEAAAEARNNAAEAAAEARNNAAEASAEARNGAAEAHAQAIADAAQAQAEQLVAQAESAAAARQAELQAQMDALSVAEQAELAAVTEKATQERNAVNLAADQHQADLLTEYTTLLKSLAEEEAAQVALIEAETRTKRQDILDKITHLADNSDALNTYNEQQGEVLGRLAAALEALNTFLAGVTQAQGGMYDPELKSNRLILAHRGETVAIGQPTRGPQATNGASVTIGVINIQGASTMTKADVKAAVEEAVVQSIRPQGAARAEMKRQGVQFA